MYRLLIVALVLTTACIERKTSDDAATVSSKEVVENKAEDAKQWLIKTITDYFSAPELSSLAENMKKSTTATYYAYKTDATNVDLDLEDSLSLEEFHKKWKDKFDTSKAGIGTGFLITAQDWSKIVVDKCNLITAQKDTFLFDVVLQDVDFQTKYPSQILVTYAAGAYRIADVRE